MVLNAKIFMGIMHVLTLTNVSQGGTDVSVQKNALIESADMTV